VSLVVIDLDRHREDVDGVVTFDKLKEGHHLPDAPIVHTAGAGFTFTSVSRRTGNGWETAEALCLPASTFEAMVASSSLPAPCGLTAPCMSQTPKALILRRRSARG
jgi:hypothetical protein